MQYFDGDCGYCEIFCCLNHTLRKYVDPVHQLVVTSYSSPNFVSLCMTQRRGVSARGICNFAWLNFYSKLLRTCVMYVCVIICNEVPRRRHNSCPLFIDTRMNVMQAQTEVKKYLLKAKSTRNAMRNKIKTETSVILILTIWTILNYICAWWWSIAVIKYTFSGNIKTHNF